MGGGLMNHAQKHRDSTGFFVVANDRELLAKVTSLLRRQGYFGVVDTAGRVNYLIDGRDNSYRAAHQIKELAALLREPDSAPYCSDDTVREIAEDVLAQYKISENLKGYLYLRKILEVLARDPTKLKPASKFLYPETAKYYRASAGQIDRVIRYATKQAGVQLSNGQFLTVLNDQIHRKLRSEAAKLTNQKNGGDKSSQ
jgi:hypothetical protein